MTDAKSIAVYRAALAARLKQARTDAGLTQMQFAERMKSTQTAVSSVECGREPIGNTRIFRWATACGIHPAVILGDAAAEFATKSIEAESVEAKGD